MSFALGVSRLSVLVLRTKILISMSHVVVSLSIELHRTEPGISCNRNIGAWSECKYECLEHGEVPYKGLEPIWLWATITVRCNYCALWVYAVAATQRQLFKISQ